MSRIKSILVLGRRDHAEAMRVAAGLTIANHRVDLVFMTEPVVETEENVAQAELLELSDIEPRTTVTGTELDQVSPAQLAAAMRDADVVVNI